MVNFFDLRLKMVRFAQEYGISKAAKEFKTTRKTVYKYLKRYKKEGLEGLKNKPKIPKNIPHKIPESYEEYILSLRDKHPCWGAKRLKLRYKLKYSHTAIHRVLKRNGRIKKKKRKHIKKKQLQEIKRKYRAFEYNQIDVKDLSDIPKYWIYMKKFKLPRYQYSFRELSTGLSFYAYSNENNSYYAGLFALYVIEHLKRYNVAPKTINIIFQTDNGPEFIGSVRKNIKKKTFFEDLLEKNNIEHRRIPTRSPTFNSDVEAFHKIIEDEFYECEDYKNEDDFLAKAYSYLLFFNYERENTNKDNNLVIKYSKKKNLI
jgi:transposase